MVRTDGDDANSLKKDGPKHPISRGFAAASKKLGYVNAISREQLLSEGLGHPVWCIEKLWGFWIEPERTQELRDGSTCTSLV